MLKESFDSFLFEDEFLVWKRPVIFILKIASQYFKLVVSLDFLELTIGIISFEKVKFQLKNQT